MNERERYLANLEKHIGASPMTFRPAITSVMDWPEFKALMERFNHPILPGCLSIDIHIERDTVPTITQKVIAEDTKHG